MQESIRFKQSELVLKVNPVYDTNRLDLNAWQPFLDQLCPNRPYQKQAITCAIIYLASGQYASLRDLAEYNYSINPRLRDKYPSLTEFADTLQMGGKRYASLDLATGTGKSYVIYGIAQIALGLGLVNRVLVLCPSLTIERGLKEKFEQLSGDRRLKALIPENALCRNPSIVSADQTVKAGDLCVENIHAVYESTGSSIQDSFMARGQDTLVLNDEAHHIFNKSSGNDASIKKWKAFLLSGQYQFQYMLGLTGTAYIEDEYFPDVIYRYSLRQAIEDRIVKNIDYVREDESKNDYERFQKIHQNHRDNIRQYPLIKPLSILVTRDIRHAEALWTNFVAFLSEWESISRQEAEQKVLLVTSSRKHRANVVRLKYVDEPSDSTQWIISVSMLTEGWDVENVFQIVPWEDRAFNSKLLVAQVLGRGLRLPKAYQSPQPKVTVFNHRAWSAKIRRLVDEVLEIETRVASTVLTEGPRSQYHFSMKNINYSTEQIEVAKPPDTDTVDFTRLMTEGIALESQSVTAETGTTYETVLDGAQRERSYTVKARTWTVEEVVDKLFEEFEQREWEGKTLKLGQAEYTQNTLPPWEVIEGIIRLSMEKRGNHGDQIVESNVHKILTAFTPLLRKSTKSMVSKPVTHDIITVDTASLDQQHISVSMLRQDRTVFLSNNWAQEVTDQEQRAVITEILEDESLPRSSLREIDYCLFKTPVTTVLTASKPERKFVEALCKRENAALLSAWIKSRDRNFYEITYSCRYGTGGGKTRKYHHVMFNPDFFLKVERENVTYILVIEIKDNQDVSEENRAKYKYAVQHFAELNRRLERDHAPEKYLFHFLSPDSYDTFFNHLKSGDLLQDQSHFRSALEILLEESRPL